MGISQTYNEMDANTSEYFECQIPILNETEKAVYFDASNSYLSTQHRCV